MPVEHGFEPHFAWEKITDEQASLIGEKLRAYKEVCEEMIVHPTPELTGRMLQLMDELNATSDVIRTQIFTVPAMIHVAGPREEIIPEDHDHSHFVQRCTRCKSELAFWCPHMMAITPEGPRRLDLEDMPWHKEGDVIGKVAHGEVQTAYLIDPGAPLESHERECVNMEEAFNGK